MIDLSPEAEQDLRQFLAYHESDIAMGLNDFGDLQEVFTEVFDREPTET